MWRRILEIVLFLTAVCVPHAHAQTTCNILSTFNQAECREASGDLPLVLFRQVSGITACTNLCCEYRNFCYAAEHTPPTGCFLVTTRDALLGAGVNSTFQQNGEVIFIDGEIYFILNNIRGTQPWAGLTVSANPEKTCVLVEPITDPPTPLPTMSPLSPSPGPTLLPTVAPTPDPSSPPTYIPTPLPSPVPTHLPSEMPTFTIPTEFPSPYPTVVPTAYPTPNPTVYPTYAPSAEPSLSPSIVPSGPPTLMPTLNPTALPSFSPSTAPTCSRVDTDTIEICSLVIAENLCSNSRLSQRCLFTCFGCTDAPSLVPTEMPTEVPTEVPTPNPTPSPTVVPTPVPTLPPTPVPTLPPTPGPTSSPSPYPSPHPTFNPTAAPTLHPSLSPTSAPTQEPSFAPSLEPSTAIPTSMPTCTRRDTEALDVCAFVLTNGLCNDPALSHICQFTCFGCSDAPTLSPTPRPTPIPTEHPSPTPTNAPSSLPTKFPTAVPTSIPTWTPTSKPTPNPTEIPSVSEPTSAPTCSRIDTNSRETCEIVKRFGLCGSEPSSSVQGNSSNPMTFPNGSGFNSSIAAGCHFTCFGCSNSPTVAPTPLPSQLPTPAPSYEPTLFPSGNPSATPTPSPSQNPTASPSPFPSNVPTHLPTSSLPTSTPSCGRQDTDTALVCSFVLTNELCGNMELARGCQFTCFGCSDGPTLSPTENPTHAPSSSPTLYPSTHEPSHSPSLTPSFMPTSSAPTCAYRNTASRENCDFVVLQGLCSNSTAEALCLFSCRGCNGVPSVAPTAHPSLAPSLAPTLHPSEIPTMLPENPYVGRDGANLVLNSTQHGAVMVNGVDILRLVDRSRRQSQEHTQTSSCKCHDEVESLRAELHAQKVAIKALQTALNKTNDETLSY